MLDGCVELFGGLGVELEAGLEDLEEKLIDFFELFWAQLFETG